MTDGKGVQIEEFINEEALVASGCDRIGLGGILCTETNEIEWTITARRTSTKQVCWIEDDTLSEVLERFHKLAIKNKLRWKADPYGNKGS